MYNIYIYIYYNIHNIRRPLERSSVWKHPPTFKIDLSDWLSAWLSDWLENRGFQLQTSCFFFDFSNFEFEF